MKCACNQTLLLVLLGNILLPTAIESNGLSISMIAETKYATTYLLLEPPGVVESGQLPTSFYSKPRKSMQVLCCESREDSFPAG